MSLPAAGWGEVLAAGWEGFGRLHYVCSVYKTHLRRDSPARRRKNCFPPPFGCAVRCGVVVTYENQIPRCAP